MQSILAPSGNRLRLIWFFALLAFLTNFLLGFSNGYPNTAGNSFQHFINESYSEKGKSLNEWEFTWFWTSFLNVWSLGYLIGNLITPPLCDNFGRKRSLLLANILNFVSAAIFTATIVLDLPILLFVGRLVCSLASAVSFGVLIIFLQEISPNELRGLASSFSEVVYLLTACIGITLGMDLVLGRSLVFLLGFGMIPSFLSILFLIPLPESPKYLLLHEKNREKAIESLKYYQGDKSDVDLLLNEMLKESEAHHDDLKLTTALTMVFKRLELRKAVCVGIMAIQLSVPIWPITFLSTELLEAHFVPEMAQTVTFAFMIVNFIASLIGIFFIERWGRRTLLIGLGVVNVFSLALYVLFDRLAFYVDPGFKYGCVGALITYAISYGFALGPIAFFVTAELVSQRFRSLVQAIVFAVNTMIEFCISFFLLPVYKIIDIWALLILFVLPGIVSLTYLYFEMPETRGKSIHEIVASLMHKRNLVPPIKGKEGDLACVDEFCECERCILKTQKEVLNSA